MHFSALATFGIAVAGAVRFPPYSISRIGPPHHDLPPRVTPHHGAPRVTLRSPTQTSSMPNCYNTAQTQCLNSIDNGNTSTLDHTGCSIIAETQCKADPKLPSFCPDPALVKHTLTWTPPPGCAAAWTRCISEICIPFFNRPICAQYLPVLCKGSLNATEEASIDKALEVLYRQYTSTLEFFYDHVPASKAVWFDRCIEGEVGNTTAVSTSSMTRNTTAAANTTTTTTAASNNVMNIIHGGSGNNNDDSPGPEIFFSCLEQVKKLNDNSTDLPNVPGT